MALQLTVTADGELRFRGVLRHGRWHVSRLRSVSPGSMCKVFRFDEGTTMLIWGSDRSWRRLCDHLVQLNPEVQMHSTPQLPFIRSKQQPR
jgi:crotonobetainyl-CoA:carnitine CoA-transferase CaiB-like acyl-CoA transferase